MLTTLAIPDLLKDKLGSDYKTAKLLKVTTQRTSKMRLHEGIMTDEQGLIAAQILGLPEELIIASLVAERSKTSPAYSILQKIADKFEPKSAAAAAIFSVFLIASYTLPALPISA